LPPKIGKEIQDAIDSDHYEYPDDTIDHMRLADSDFVLVVGAPDIFHNAVDKHNHGHGEHKSDNRIKNINFDVGDKFCRLVAHFVLTRNSATDR